MGAATNILTNDKATPRSGIKTTRPAGVLDVAEQKSRDLLDYEWQAIYKDGSTLDQYDDNNNLVYHFGHIDKDRVVFFTLNHRTQSINLSINLEVGLFTLNHQPLLSLNIEGEDLPLGLSIANKDVQSAWGDKVKLIYFRHIRKDFSSTLDKVKTSITYELGWEATVEGKKEKHTVTITGDGDFVISVDSQSDNFKAL